MLKIYNTLTKTKEEFKPLTKNEIKMYVCGPTLYSDIHIGNARPIIFFDVVYRYLTEIGYKVKYVTNITDIDDKIINKAEEEKISEKELIENNTQNFLNILEQLNISSVYKRPTVTQYIEEIINYIQKLLDLNYAYLTEQGDIYFRVNKIENYGEISKREISQLQGGNREILKRIKENEEDFVLWKKTTKGITWNASFGRGRPGWHTECVVMINQILGNKIDIHAGGMDLKFPHHENENAQNIALKGEGLANYWMHNGFVNINNEKMSKSLNNFLTVKDALTKYNANILRLLLLQTNYRQPINLTEEFIKQTIKLNNKIQQYVKTIHKKKVINLNKMKIEVKLTNIMDDDFNVPNLISLLLEEIKKDQKQNVLKIINILGLTYPLTVDEDDLEEEAKKYVIQILQAKKEQNYEELKRFQEKLQLTGYNLEFTRQGYIITK